MSSNNGGKSAVLARDNLKRYEPAQPCAAFDVDDAVTLAACESIKTTQAKNGKLHSFRGKGGGSNGTSSIRGSKASMGSLKSGGQLEKAPIVAPTERVVPI